MTKEGTDALIQLWADDVLEFAGLVVGFGIVDRESVFEQPLGQAVTADHIASAPVAVVRQAHFAIVQLHQPAVGHAR
jgi:hypothetical protein